MNEEALKEKAEKARASVEHQFEEWLLDEDAPAEDDQWRREVWCSGVWLDLELEKRGCDERLRHDICFATGQRQAMLQGDDRLALWVLAVIALERYEKGAWDVPGVDLAERLCKEAWGDPPDPRKVAGWFEAVEARKRKYA